jgi:hypothetical protein
MSANSRARAITRILSRCKASRTSRLAVWVGRFPVAVFLHPHPMRFYHLTRRLNVLSKKLSTARPRRTDSIDERLRRSTSFAVEETRWEQRAEPVDRSGASDSSLFISS